MAQKAMIWIGNSRPVRPVDQNAGADPYQGGKMVGTFPRLKFYTDGNQLTLYVDHFTVLGCLNSDCDQGPGKGIDPEFSHLSSKQNAFRDKQGGVEKAPSVSL